MSVVAGAAFRWLELLEQEFDTAYVRLDTAVGEIDADDPETAYAVRQKMTALSSCFAQLSHKAQTIFQNSAKVEAELINLRTELVEARASRDMLEQQRNPSGLAPGMIVGENVATETARLREECAQLYGENAALRSTILALHSEVYGARLAAKYLDKELAGRIQQLQLLGREMKGEVRDRLWRQLESEILLQRHKTVVRACRSARGNTMCTGGRNGAFETRTVAGEPRHVAVPRAHQQGLGISITGGREHGVPILISELEADGPAAQTGQLYVGDAILSVNNIDLRQACHKEAVSILQNQTGDCTLCVQFVAEDSDEENFLSEDEYTYKYPIFPIEDGAAGEATPTAPRTPDPAHLHRRSGSEDFSDYLVTPDKACTNGHQHNTQNSYYNVNNDVSPAYHGSYGDYYTAQRYMMMQDSILDMDDNSIKIQTEIKNSHDDNMNNNSDNDSKRMDFLNIEVVDDTSNKEQDPIISVNNSLSNSESASSPVQTSSDNNIVSSGISCGNLETSADSKSPVDIIDKLNGNDKSITDITKCAKNARYNKTASRKKSCDKGFEENIYDKNNDINQNVGFVYPKQLNLKSFNQYSGLSGNSFENYESSLSPDSVETTPVHGKKVQNKIARKRRSKGGDWKSKGIYQAIDNNNTSDMESPNRIVKPDKRYYKENDTLVKVGVKTIQSIFEKNMKNTKSSEESNESDVALCQRLSPQKVIDTKLQVDDAPLLSFTPELKADTEEVKENSCDIVKVEEVIIESQNLTKKPKMKNREFRIGTAKRIPPPPDVIHIPLKDLVNELTLKSNNEEVSEDKNKQEKINVETEINDVYPKESTSLMAIDDAEIDNTLKLALSKLEMSMANERFTKMPQKSSPFPVSDSYYSMKQSEYYSTNKGKYVKCDSVSSFAKDLIIEGNGDPDFGTPV